MDLPHCTPNSAPHHTPKPHCPGHSCTTRSHHGFIWHHCSCCTAANKYRTGYWGGPHTAYPKGWWGGGQDGQRALHTHKQIHIQTDIQTLGKGRAASPTSARHPLPLHTRKGNLRTTHTPPGLRGIPRAGTPPPPPWLSPRDKGPHPCRHTHTLHWVQTNPPGPLPGWLWGPAGTPNLPPTGGLQPHTPTPAPHYLLPPPCPLPVTWLPAPCLPHCPCVGDAPPTLPAPPWQAPGGHPQRPPCSRER